MGSAKQGDRSRTESPRWRRVARIRARLESRRYELDADATARALVEAARRGRLRRD